MPRTKISKSSKRNREVSQREEKVREFETTLEAMLEENVGSQLIEEVESQVSMLIRRSSKKLLQMKFHDFLELNLAKFTEWTPMLTAQNASSSRSICSNNTMLRSAKVSNPNDEGYLTEDSTNGGSGANSLAVLTNMTQLHMQQQQQRGRTPGPLSSARARRPRRSKSFCGDYVPGSATQKKTVAQSVLTSEHASRNKLRTPLAPRTKALSADRTSKYYSSHASPPTAFMRWPKPGEMVVSTCGSPLVAQILPDKYANVNIPVRNGVLSLRPKKLSELNPEMIEGIDQETLNQIKTLHANLNLIMDMADKAIIN